jgi:hypothetical protein
LPIARAACRGASLDRWRSPVDPSQVPHCKQKIVDEFLRIAESTSGWR